MEAETTVETHDANPFDLRAKGKDELQVDLRVNGKDELQDAADIIREIMPNVTVRNNQTVNFYMTVNKFNAPGGDDDAES